MEITPQSRVGEIAASFPLATRVFARHRIDFCCGGGIPLVEVCERRGLDPEASRRRDRCGPCRYPRSRRRAGTRRPLDELVRHLLTAYHAPLREELPRLEAMVRKVASVHGEREPVRLPALQAAFLALEADLTQHMDSEEAELFPPILERGVEAAPAVAAFRDDHTEVGRLLGEIRALTDDFRLPDGACNTWSALWHGLEALETDLHHHIHLENNVLFPRLAAA